MIRQYVIFFFNGGILGIFAILIQLLIYSFIGAGNLNYAIASASTYFPLIVINFLIQKKFIFKRSGLFFRFILASMIIMILVSVLSPIFRMAIDWILDNSWGDRVGFALASLVGSLPSFWLQRNWVFAKSSKNY